MAAARPLAVAAAAQRTQWRHARRRARCWRIGPLLAWGVARVVLLLLGPNRGEGAVHDVVPFSLQNKFLMMIR